MSLQIDVSGLSMSFGSSTVWEDVTLTVRAGEVSVLLGPSGTGKSVFSKSLIGLLRPQRGSIVIDHQPRRVFGPGALRDPQAVRGDVPGRRAVRSMTIYDNTAFPVREHTRKSESEIRKIVMEKLEIVGIR